MEEKSQQCSNPHEECIDVVDKLHELAHNGCFDSMDDGVVRKATQFLRGFLDVNVTLKEASTILDKPLSTIKNHVYRKLPPEEYPRRNSVIRLSKLLKIIPSSKK